MRHTRAGRLTLMVIGVLPLAAFAVACGSSGSSTSSGSASTQATGSSAAMTSIVVGALPVVDTAGLQVALKEGFFKQAGLNVTVKSVTQSTAAIPDLLHGSIDVIGGGNYVSFFEAQAHGTFPVEILAPAADCTANTYGVVAMPSSGITKPADLAGKTIAVNLTQNVQTLTTSAVLDGGRRERLVRALRADPLPGHGRRAEGGPGERHQRRGAVPVGGAGGRRASW